MTPRKKRKKSPCAIDAASKSKGNSEAPRQIPPLAPFPNPESDLSSSFPGVFLVLVLSQSPRKHEKKKNPCAKRITKKAKATAKHQDKSRPSPPSPIPCQTYLHPFLVSSLHRISILKISSPGRKTTAKPREDRAGDTHTPCHFLPMKNEESARSCGVSPLCACADYWDKERAERFCCSLHAKM